MIDMLKKVEGRGWVWLMRTDEEKGYMVHLMSPEWEDARERMDDNIDSYPHVVVFGANLTEALADAVEAMPGQQQ